MDQEDKEKLLATMINSDDMWVIVKDNLLNNIDKEESIKATELLKELLKETPEYSKATERLNDIDEILEKLKSK